MAARDPLSPSRSGYLALFYALNELRSGTLKNHITGNRFYNQPLASMVKDMHLLLQAKDPDRKFPQTIPSQQLPEYFNRLLHEVNSQTAHDYYGKIEQGIRKGKWADLPVPSEDKQNQPQVPPTPEVHSEQSNEEPPKIEEPKEPPKEKSIPRRVTHGGSSPKAKPQVEEEKKPSPSQGQVRPTRVSTTTGPAPVKQPSIPPSPPPQIHLPESLSRAIPKPPVAEPPAQKRLGGFGQGRVRPSKVLGPLKKPTLDLGSRIVRQIIRHPIAKTRMFTTVLGAVGGGLLGGPEGAGAGAVLGGVFGPQIGSSFWNFMTAGRSEATPSGGDEAGSSGNSGGGRGRGGGGFFRNQLGNRAGRFASNATRRAALGAARAAIGFASANIWWIALAVGIGILFLIILWILLCVLPFSNCGGVGPGGNNQQITLQKSAPLQVENGGSLEYKITVSNKGSSLTSVTVSDNIPTDTVYESGDNDPVQEGVGVKRVQWTVQSLGPGQSKTLTFKVKPQKQNFWIINQATASASSYGGSSSSGGLLPNPLPAAIGNWASTRDSIIAAVNKYPEVVAAYQKASSLTGVPWEVLAGLHYVETGNNPRPSASLVSGRNIGVREPDIPPSACAAGETGPGTPIPMGGGCGFSNFEDSAIYAAKHIVSKINKVPQTFEDAVIALSRYNGGGNRNCGRGVPYNFCPRDFEGEDDPYSMNYFDQKHSEMYLIYCADFTQCSPARPFGRPGSMAVIRALTGN